MRVSTLSGHPGTGFLFPHLVEALLSSFIQVNCSRAILAYDHSSPLGPWARYGVSRLNDSLSILISCQDEF